MRKDQSTTSAETVVKNVLRVKRGERVLIIANPKTASIAQELYTVCVGVDAVPVLVYQSEKASLQYADPCVIGALKNAGDVVISVSSLKLGHDEEAERSPYVDDEGKKHDHIFDFLLDGKKCIRAAWTPGITPEMFERTVNIDYDQLADRCKKLCAKFENAVSVRVTTAAGTDITIPVEGRRPMSDDGDFSKAGSGGNIPAGEVFISPVVGNGEDCGAVGRIVFDGSMTFADGDALLETPIDVSVKGGFVTEIEGGEEAKRLLKTINDASSRALQMEKKGGLPAGVGEVYSRNARNIGELGIGLNPAAVITGNMLEDEKAFKTCHIAIGENYDGDAPSLIHLDGVIRLPTIVVNYANGKDFMILQDGILKV